MTAAWKKTFALLVALQALALLGLAGAAYAAVWFGEDIRVRTAPVDPRDFLYGDYVTLSYEMSRLSPALWQGGKLPEEGDAVYVALEPRDGLHVPVAAYPNRVRLPDGQVLLKGIVEYRWEEEIQLRYGLERYYVPEGTGLALERQVGEVVVAAKVSPWGQAILTDVLTKN